MTLDHDRVRGDKEPPESSFPNGLQLDQRGNGREGSLEEHILVEDDARDGENNSIGE